MTWIDWLIVVCAVWSVLLALFSVRAASQAYRWSKDAEESAADALTHADRAAGCLATCERAVTKTRDLHEERPPKLSPAGERYGRLAR